MNHSTATTCKLCQKVLVGNDFEKIEENARTSGSNVNLDITEDDLICVDCATIIMRHFLVFKSMCLNTENHIKNILLKFVDDAKLNLKQVLQLEDLELKEMADDQNVCRFCMDVVNKGCFKLLSEMEPIFLNSIKQNIGDLDLTLTEDPVLCESCLNTMQKHFDFLNDLYSEQKLESVEKIAQQKLESDEKIAQQKLESVEKIARQKKGKSEAMSVFQDTTPLTFVDLNLGMVDVVLLSNAVCNHAHTTDTFIPNAAHDNSIITQCPDFYHRPEHVNINALHYHSGPAADDTQTNDCGCEDGNCGYCDWVGCDGADCDDCGDCIAV